MVIGEVTERAFQLTSSKILQFKTIIMLCGAANNDISLEREPIQLPEADADHELLHPADDRGRLDNQDEGQGVAEQEPDEQNVAQLTTGSTDDWSIVVPDVDTQNCQCKDHTNECKCHCSDGQWGVWCQVDLRQCDALKVVWTGQGSVGAFQTSGFIERIQLLKSRRENLILWISQ